MSYYATENVTGTSVAGQFEDTKLLVSVRPRLWLTNRLQLIPHQPPEMGHIVLPAPSRQRYPGKLNYLAPLLNQIHLIQSLPKRFH